MRRWLSFAIVGCVGIFARLEDAFADQPELHVTVEGDALLPRADDPTIASTVVEGEALARPGVTATDALAATPGVRVSRTGSGSDLATLSLRGTSNAQTPVYLAGVKLNDEVSGTADISTVPLFFLKRITVYRGDAPFELPDLGLAGAVVFEPELPKKTRLGSGIGVGSFGERSEWVAASAGNARAAAAFAVRLEGATNDYLYTNDQGTRFDPSDDRDVRRHNADSKAVDAWAVARVRLGDRGTLTMVSNVLSRDQGLTGLGIIPARETRSTLHRALFAVEARSRCNGDPGDDRCEVEASAFGKTVGYLYRDPLLELPFGSTRDVVRGDQAGYRVAVHARPARFARLAAGANQTFDLLEVSPLGGDTLNARRATSRAFASAELSPVEILTLSLGASIASSRTAGPDTTSSLLTPEVRLGAHIQPIPELGFFAGVARYERMPTLGETYGVSASVIGNSSLRPERGPSFEAGARFSRPLGKNIELAAEALFFFRAATDLIGYERTSFGIVRPYNVGSARILGSEMTFALTLFRALRIDDALTLNDARDESKGRTLVNDALPFQAATVNASALHLLLDRFCKSSAPNPCSLGTTFIYRSARAADPAGLVVLPRQLSWDLDAAVGFARGLVTARVRISNLLDDRSTDNIGYPLPGRAGHATLEAWWP